MKRGNSGFYKSMQRQRTSRRLSNFNSTPIRTESVGPILPVEQKIKKSNMHFRMMEMGMTARDLCKVIVDYGIVYMTEQKIYRIAEGRDFPKDKERDAINKSLDVNVFEVFKDNSGSLAYRVIQKPKKEGKTT